MATWQLDAGIAFSLEKIEIFDSQVRHVQLSLSERKRSVAIIIIIIILLLLAFTGDHRTNPPKIIASH